MKRPSAVPSRVSAGTIAAGLIASLLIHAGLALGFSAVDSAAPLTGPQRNKAKERRYRHGPVAFERRRLELDCTSIPECEPHIAAEIIIPKFAKLGMAEPDPKKLPEIQKYEEPEKQELAINVAQQPQTMKPKKLQDFLRRKAQLDKRRRKRKKPKTRDLFNIDDDPRARATAFEKITGRLDGNVYGKGIDQEKFDTYFGKMAYELHKVFNPPTSLSRKEVRVQLVTILITGMGADGTITGYRVRRRAKKKGFTVAAEATLREFMPSEGGQRRLPAPPQDVLDFVNKKGILLDLDGRQFE